MRFRQTTLTPLVIFALAIGAAPALAARAEDRPAAQTAEIEAALQRDLGLSAAQAKALGALQAKATEREQAAQASLGDAFAGSEFDAKTGRLTVMVSDADQLAKTRSAGVDAKLVKYSRGALEQIKDRLDAAARRRAAVVAGMTSWYVDDFANSVHVTVEPGRARQAQSALAAYGDAVTIEASTLAPRTTIGFMDGGDAIDNGNCSAGFNLRNPSTGEGYLLTAGHCVAAGVTLSGLDWVPFGPVLEKRFPTHDDAIARNTSGNWIQGPWVDVSPSDGGVVATSGYTYALPGATICKSGVTTKWTCGKITGRNQTVAMNGNQVVYGLTRHNACAEPGDSGGATVSLTDTWEYVSAEGVTSGASLLSDGTRLRCLSAFGKPDSNVTWYYPIVRSLRHYGPEYGVTVW